jgi:hypothetical protein
MKIWLSLAAALLATAACLLQALAASEEPYEPSARVKLYNTKDFETNTDYFVSLGMWKAGPFVVLGVFFFFLLIFWSFGRTCCRCCCRQPTAVSRRHHLFFAFLGVTMALACTALLFYGLYANKAQDDAISEVPILIDNIIDFKNNAVSELRSVQEIAVNIINSILTIDEDIRNTFVSDFEEVNNSLTTIIDETENIIQQLEDAGFEDVRDDFSNEVESINSDRDRAVIATLVLLIVILGIRLLMMFLNSHGPTCLRPSKSLPCKIIHHIITVLIVILVLLTFIIAGLLLFVASISADFCITPDAHIINIANLENNDEAVFFLTCHSANLTNPITGGSNVDSLFNGITDGITEANSLIDTLNSSTCDDVAGNAACQSAVNTMVDITQELVNLNESLGVDSNGDGDYETGILSLANCANLNGKYQAVLNVICGKFFDALAKFFETFAAFASIFVLLEILKRRYPKALGEDVYDDDEEVDPKYAPGNSTELSKYDVNTTTDASFYPASSPPDYTQPPQESNFNNVGDQGYPMYPNQQAANPNSNQQGMYPEFDSYALPDDPYANPS